MCYQKLTLFIISKGEWDTKKHIGKPMKNAWHVLQPKAKTMSNGKPLALAIVELCLSGVKSNKNFKFYCQSVFGSILRDT